ncbi:MAG: hypothetical protein PHG06_18310, partial [Parabacteroides sp.]|nr:hypothetical protein [Parabacteroides sp.]
MDKYAKEAQFSTLPIVRKERPYGFMDSSFVNTGWGIATWCFLTGGLLAGLVDFKTAVLACLTGNVIGVALVAVASTTISFKYGMDTYTSIIAFFGKMGMKIVLGIFLITNLGWVVVLASMCARSSHSISNAISGVELTN